MLDATALTNTTDVDQLYIPPKVHRSNSYDLPLPRASLDRNPATFCRAEHLVARRESYGHFPT